MLEKIKPSEITDILKKEIENFDGSKGEAVEYGHVLQIGDGIVRANGMNKVMMNELVEFSNGTKGMALNLEEDNVGILLFGASDEIKEGDKVKRLKEVIDVPVGEALLGRVVDPIGVPLDGGVDLGPTERRKVEVKAEGIMQRKEVKEPLQTGIKVIDSIVPIGRGQRELIIGDRQTGKTSVALDTIINQKGKGVKCIYVSIGQKQSSVAAMVSRLKKEGAMDYTTVVLAPASYPSPYLFIAPYAGVAMAEYFMFKGEHALIVYDDLTKQAQAYRELSLLLKRPPGREAYPGDVFYLHSRLLERAAKLSDDMGGGSITALPIVETQAGDVSAYIPTNVISITDGQIFLSTELFNAGQRPAMDIGISVSRVGGSAQVSAMKKAIGPIKANLQQYLEIKAFSQFASDLDEVTKKQLNRGQKLMEMMKQGVNSPLEVVDQIIILFSGTRGYLDNISLDQVQKYERALIEYLYVRHKEIISELEETKSISGELEKKLEKVVEDFTKSFA